MSWDGNERRETDMRDKDHDLLIEINANLKNLMGNHTQHLIDDARQFGEINTMVKGLQRDKWIGYGVITTVILVIRFVFKV